VLSAVLPPAFFASLAQGASPDQPQDLPPGPAPQSGTNSSK